MKSEENPTARKSGFADVDRANDPASFVRYLENVSTLPSALAYKHRTFELLAVGASDVVLDIGSGIGTDIQTMMQLPQPPAKAVGVEVSYEMMQAAIAATSQDLLRLGRVRFQYGDAHALPFANNAFDKTRCDRTLQHVVDPEKALEEMVRVTKSGGRIVVAEPNWEELEIAGVDTKIVAVIGQTFQGIIRNPYIGISLRGTFINAGLINGEVYRMSLISDESFTSLNEMLWLDRSLEKAANIGIIAQEQATECLNVLRNAPNPQATLGLYIAKGVKR